MGGRPQCAPLLPAPRNLSYPSLPSTDTYLTFFFNLTLILHTFRTCLLRRVLSLFSLYSNSFFLLGENTFSFTSRCGRIYNHLNSISLESSCVLCFVQIYNTKSHRSSFQATFLVSLSIPYHTISYLTIVIYPSTRPADIPPWRLTRLCYEPIPD